MYSDVNPRLGTIKPRIALMVIFVALFALIAILVKTGNTAGMDETVRQFAYSIRNPFLNKFMIVISMIGYVPGIVGIIVVMLIIPKTRLRVGVPMMLSSAVAYGFYKVVKHIFARPRPDASMWLTEEHGFSFPSGHSMNSLICFIFLAILLWRIIDSGAARKFVLTVCIILVALVGFSRLVIGVHYITDVLGGFSLGLAWVTLMTIFYDLFFEHHEAEKRRKAGRTRRSQHYR